MSEILRGSIYSYIYKSEDSLYKVARIWTSEDQEVIIVGSFLELEERILQKLPIFLQNLIDGHYYYDFVEFQISLYKKIYVTIRKTFVPKKMVSLYSI